MDSSLATEAILAARGFGSFALGFGVAFFSSVAALATRTAALTCSTSILEAVFGNANFVGATTCIGAATVGVMASSIAGGLGAFGSSVGWKFETDGAEVGERSTFQPIVHYALGVSHYYDADTHRFLNQTYGTMLDSYNTTILSVSWMETLPDANHTGGVLENLNMTNGRFVTLLDNGVIRTALGATASMGHIVEEFDRFKRFGSLTNPLNLKKRDGVAAPDWLSFNTYGENMKEGAQFLGDFNNVQNTIREGQNLGTVANWVQASSGEYQSKFCCAASPSGNGPGQNSIIVGEVYMNDFGGIDGECDSG